MLTRDRREKLLAVLDRMLADSGERTVVEATLEVQGASGMEGLLAVTGQALAFAGEDILRGSAEQRWDRSQIGRIAVERDFLGPELRFQAGEGDPVTLRRLRHDDPDALEALLEALESSADAPAPAEPEQPDTSAKPVEPAAPEEPEAFDLGGIGFEPTNEVEPEGADLADISIESVDEGEGEDWFASTDTGAEPLPYRAAASSAHIEGYALAFAMDDRPRHVLPLGTEEHTIGRAGADIVVEHPSLSRRHCRLVPRSDGVTVVDLASSNGTYIDGERVDRGLLTPGCELRLGSAVRFVLLRQGDPPDAFPPPPSEPQPMSDAARLRMSVLVVVALMTLSLMSALVYYLTILSS